MNLRAPILVLGLSLLLAPINAQAQQKTILFDAMHAQTAGNADWTLDEDVCGTAQRYPTPDQAGITSSTAETYWSGAFSAMGVDLVKKGFHVESLPIGSRVTYNDATNAQDLKNYNVYVIPEPNIRLTAAEITAIRSFVQNGGGLLMIADHAGADRNNDGWDPPAIFNDMMGSPSVFGITYNANSADKTLGWFDDHPDVNYTADTTSPIVWAGAFGVPSSTKGLGLFGSTSMVLSGGAKGHIWRTTSTKDTATGVTFATSTYGTGRIAAVGDSSVDEDATNGCSHTTYLGYNDPSYDNGLITANAVAWVANGIVSGGDTIAPTTSITAPVGGSTVSGTVSVTASASDNVGVTKVEFYLDGVLKSTDTTSPYAWSWDTTGTPNGAHSLTSKAYDAALNVGTSAAVSVTVNNVTGTSTDISGWTVTQANATITYTIPAGTIIAANGYVVIGRQATQSAFQTFWNVTLGSNVVYLNGNGAFPQINGSETYTVKNASGTVIDGATIAMSSAAGQDLQRIDPCLAAGTTSSWTIGATTAANPGSGAAAGCAKGVVINEFSDAAGSGNYVYEFVELHNDK